MFVPSSRCFPSADAPHATEPEPEGEAAQHECPRPALDLATQIEPYDGGLTEVANGARELPAMLVDRTLQSVAVFLLAHRSLRADAPDRGGPPSHPGGARMRPRPPVTSLPPRQIVSSVVR